MKDEMTIPKSRRYMKDIKLTSKISVRFSSDINLAKPKHLRYLQRYLTEVGLPANPEMAEGVIDFEGVQHFFTYMVEDGMVDMTIAPREDAEALLNEQGLSTHEPWSPWPGCQCASCQPKN